MGIQLPLVFLLIAQNRGISAARLRQLTGLSQSAISRNICALTKEGKPDEPGLGLVAKTVNLANPRAHAIHLTKAGRALAARLADALAKAVRVRGVVDDVKSREVPRVPLAAAAAVPMGFAGAHWEVWVD